MIRVFSVKESPIKSILLFFLPFLIGFIFSHIYLNIKIYKDCVEKNQYVTDDFKLDCKLSSSDY